MKEKYIAPLIEVIEVKSESIICDSGQSGFQDYGWNDEPEE